MDPKKEVLKETIILALGQAVLIALMFFVFFAFGYFDVTVLVGGIIGGLVAVLNYLFMAIGVTVASQKAVSQDVKGGKSVIRLSMLIRYILIFVIWAACVESGLANIFAIVLPIVFVRPIITVREFMRPKSAESAVEAEVEAEPADDEKTGEEDS